MLKLKLQYLGHRMQRTDSLEKTLVLGKTEGRRRLTEDEMVGWHHGLSGHEFEQTLGDGEGQRSLVDYSPWGRKESALHIRWPKYWSFSLRISPSNEYSGLFSFRIDWFDLAVQGTLKSLLQHHSSKASILRHSALFKSNSHIHM